MSAVPDAEAQLLDAPFVVELAAAVPPLQVYAQLLGSAVAHAAGGPPVPRVRVRTAEGALEPFHLERWLAPTSPADDAIVDRSTAPVLDVGCGPGRLLEALEAADKPSLGVDLVPAAVRIARARGGQAVQGSIFGDIPGDSTWATALLLDGNIGIGGLPAALLERVAALLRPGGQAIVELDAPGSATGSSRVRIESDESVSEWFAWARVAVDAIEPIAADAGLATAETFELDGRWFAVLTRRR